MCIDRQRGWREIYRLPSVPSSGSKELRCGEPIRKGGQAGLLRQGLRWFGAAENGN